MVEPRGSSWQPIKQLIEIGERFLKPEVRQALHDESTDLEVKEARDAWLGWLVVYRKVLDAARYSLS